jgi:uncharacterized protein YegP (UPF0339 family)
MIPMTDVAPESLPVPRFEIRQGRKRRSKRKPPQWYVVLIAANGEIVNTSEMLTSVDACRTNIAAAKKAGARSTPIHNSYSDE